MDPGPLGGLAADIEAGEGVLGRSQQAEQGAPVQLPAAGRRQAGRAWLGVVQGGTTAAGSAAPSSSSSSQIGRQSSRSAGLS